jgi:microcompartment protein CcmL/EutN
MSTPPAIAVLEFDSIAIGMRAADAMVKKAPINTFRIGTVQPGKYIVVVGGAVAEVDESRREGLRVGGERITDEIFLPDVHVQVFTAIEGQRRENTGDALGILETSAIPTTIAAADKAIKTAEVTIVEIRLGDGLGGRGITLLTGLVHNVQAAIEAAVAVAQKPNVMMYQTVIPIQHGELRERIEHATRLYPRPDRNPEGHPAKPPTTAKRRSRR